MPKSNVLYLDDYRERELSAWIWLPVGTIAMIVVCGALMALPCLLFFAGNFLPAH